MAVMSEKAKRGEKRGRPVVAERMQTIASFKGSAEFDAWFRKLVDHLRMPAASVMENALIEFARSRNFPDPAPKR